MIKTISFKIDKPDDVSDADFLRWLRFALGELGDLPMDHPMIDHEIEAEFGSVQIEPF